VVSGTIRKLLVIRRLAFCATPHKAKTDLLGLQALLDQGKKGGKKKEKRNEEEQDGKRKERESMQQPWRRGP